VPYLSSKWDPPRQRCLETIRIKRTFIAKLKHILMLPCWLFSKSQLAATSVRFLKFPRVIVANTGYARSMKRWLYPRDNYISMPWNLRSQNVNHNVNYARDKRFWEIGKFKIHATCIWSFLVCLLVVDIAVPRFSCPVCAAKETALYGHAAIYQACT